jgi:hypothetical protein
MNYIVGINLNTLNEAVDILEDTEETVHLMLEIHDRVLGRTTEKNKNTANSLEDEIKRISKVINDIKAEIEGLNE